MARINHNENLREAAAEGLKVISNAADSASKVIVQSAADAVRVLTSAAADAASVVSAAAAVSAKVVDEKSGTDHDLLIEMKTQMAGLKDDIRNLRDEQVLKVSGHEIRISDLERSNIRLVVSVCVGSAWLLAVTSMLIYHLFKMPS